MWQKKPQKRTEEVCFGSPAEHNKTKKQAKIDDIYKLATSVKRQTTDRYDIDKIKIRKDLAF